MIFQIIGAGTHKIDSTNMNIIRTIVDFTEKLGDKQTLKVFKDKIIK